MKRFLLVCIVAGFASCKGEISAPRPNVILIMADDLGWGDTGFNGNAVIQTPNLDMLASKGMVFNRFYSASAVCSPTRASCLIGRNPYRTNVVTANSGYLKKEEVTLAEVLKNHGYQTGHFGKWHLGTLTTKIRDANRGRPGNTEEFSIPSQHGFEVFFSTESKVPTFDPMMKPKVFQNEKGESLRYGWAAVDDGDSSEAYGTHYWNGKEMMVQEGLRGEDSEIIVDKAMDFMKESSVTGDPFFAVIWLHAPHLPVVADERHRNVYKTHELQEQLYFGTITALDEQIGKLWGTLVDLDEEQNTILWFCSDNGPENGTPGTAGIFRERKRSLYEGGVRVPAFCVWENGIQPNQKSSVPMVTSDYFPTILDMLSIDHQLNRPMDGISLEKVISGDQKERAAPIGFLFAKKISWVNDQYKLISTDEGKTFELYDLIRDPKEANDIAAENEELVEQMRKELFKWKKSVENSRQGGDYL